MTILCYEQKAISGHNIPNVNLAYWIDIIEEWSLLIDRYCRTFEDDAPYWYTERANVGVLAGACWRAGFVALEEFQSEKGYSNKPKRPGRADLWIANGNVNTCVEAKMKRISLNSKNVACTLIPILESALDNAIESRGSQKNLDALGMTFVPVYIPSKDEKKVDERISAMVEDIKSNFRGDMIFWHFPSESRVLKSSTGKYCWPGLIVIAQKG